MDQLPTKSEIIFYQTDDGGQRIEVRLEDETVWLSQRLLSELFHKDVRTINEHIKNIYDEGECIREATIRKFRIVRNEGSKKLTKADTVISKNYLNEEEITTLELLVSQYLDFAELQARRRKVMTMAEWKNRLDAFLELNEQTILTHSGKISASLAKDSAYEVYESFDGNRRQIEANEADEELRRAVNDLAKKE